MSFAEQERAYENIQDAKGNRQMEEQEREEPDKCIGCEYYYNCDGCVVDKKEEPEEDEECDGDCYLCLDSKYCIYYSDVP